MNFKFIQVIQKREGFVPFQKMDKAILSGSNATEEVLNIFDQL